MATERSLVLVKPDGVQRGLVGEILGRFERKGFAIAALRLVAPDEALIRAHYAEHAEKPFFSDLLKYFMTGPVVAFVLEGDKVIEVSRKIMGATKFFEAAPGTIRGDYAFSMTENLVHGSDSPESAAREIELWFKGL
jgi:nucleoside-diphosphate kinase